MPKYGKPAVASWSADCLDVFFKSKQGTLVRAWIAGGLEGSHDLGGSLDSVSWRTDQCGSFRVVEVAPQE